MAAIASECFSAVKGRFFRITETNECGTVVTGSGAHQGLTEGWIKVDFSPEYEDGQEYLQRLANGELCINQRGAPTLKRLPVTIDICVIDPALIAMMSGQTPLLDDDDVTTGIGYYAGSITGHFQLEVWQELTGSCVDPRYLYWNAPHVTNVKVGNWTVENEKLLYSIEAEGVGDSTDLIWSHDLTDTLPGPAYCGLT